MAEPKALNVSMTAEYLNYDQIQNIINNVMQYDTWAERQVVIDKMTLLYATDLTEKTIDELGLQVFIESGAVSRVKASLKNYDQITEGIKYHESWGRVGQEALKFLKELEGFAKDGKLTYAIQELIKNGNGVSE